MYDEGRFYPKATAPVENKPIEEKHVGKNGSAIRSSVKFGLTAILDTEKQHILQMIALKKASVFSCHSFDEIARLVDEVLELEKSLKKIDVLIEAVREA